MSYLKFDEKFQFSKLESTTLLKTIPWDALARERSIGINCGVRSAIDITVESVEEMSLSGKKGTRKITVRAEAPSSFRVIYKMERECTWCLEIELKQAEVILQREKWKFFEAISLTYP